jgi:hypothetical protein
MCPQHGICICRKWELFRAHYGPIPVDFVRLAKPASILRDCLQHRLIFPTVNFTSLHRNLIFELTARHHLPAMYARRFFADEGGLVSYGPRNAAFLQGLGELGRIVGRTDSDLAATRSRLLLDHLLGDVGKSIPYFLTIAQAGSGGPNASSPLMWVRTL